MKTIKRGLWHPEAMLIANEHNRKCHGGKPTAFIYVDRMSDKEFLPTYEVRCPACPAEQQGRLGLGEE